MRVSFLGIACLLVGSGCGQKAAPECWLDSDCETATLHCLDGRCVADGHDGGIPDGGLPPGCLHIDFDCSGPASPDRRQSKDMDSDGWGECCDCDDFDEQVYPEATEIWFNGIDDDCDPDTPDDPCSVLTLDCTGPGLIDQGQDADGDGWGMCCDCDDHARLVYPGRPEVWGNGIDDDCNPRTLDDGSYLCEVAEPDCSAQNLNQGADQDGDGWGACCDCDDSDPQVHPGRTELIYNNKDDDCNPLTTDGDCPPDCSRPDGYCQGADYDLDGWGLLCDCDDGDENVHPGQAEILDNGIDDDCNALTLDEGTDCEAPELDCSQAGTAGQGPDADHDGWGTCCDCDDQHSQIYPGAEERCNGLDHDCDGEIGAVGCACPDISGEYNVNAYCYLLMGDEQFVQLVQTGCDVSFFLDVYLCTGTIDEALNLYVECAGFGFPCSSKVSLIDYIFLDCSLQCSFFFEPADENVVCSHHLDPVCTQAGQLCSVVGGSHSPVTACVSTLPLGREPGYYCDDDLGIYCKNSLCIDSVCAAICQDDTHCDEFGHSSCQTVAYDNGYGTVGNIQACMPEIANETRCESRLDCAAGSFCSYRQADESVKTVCRPTNPDAGVPGDVCMSGTDCQSNLCICDGALCSGLAEGFCSQICGSDSDCISSRMCGLVTIPDLGGTDRLVSACVPDPDSCGSNADCPVGKSCQVWMEDLELVTQCWYGAGPATDNTGQPCANDTNCFSVWCNSTQNYCLGVCLNDGDCPSYDSGAGPCSTDAECALDQLCEAGQCIRPFECATHVYFMGYDDQAREVFDTVNLCRPERRPCALDGDCRLGEVCSQTLDKTAWVAEYSCVDGLGAGQLGDDCFAGGAASCWSGMCLVVDGGGPGNQYCSQACLVAADCGDLGQWDCQALRYDVRPGVVGYLPGCVSL